MIPLSLKKNSIICSIQKDILKMEIRESVFKKRKCIRENSVKKNQVYFSRKHLREFSGKRESSIMSGWKFSALFTVHWELKLQANVPPDCCCYSKGKKIKNKNPPKILDPTFPLPHNHFPPGNRTGGSWLPGDTVTTRKTNVESNWVVESGLQINMLGLNFHDQWMV